MGRTKKKSTNGKDARQNAMKYRVVHRSYEDKDYLEKPLQVLVPEATIERQFQSNRKEGMTVRFAEEVEDFTNKRNMLMDDDTIEDRLFEDEVEEEFDDDFIQQMMTGDGDDGAGSDAGKGSLAPSFVENAMHSTQTYRESERQFARAFEDYEEAEIEADDARAQGPLNIKEYGAVLEQFISEQGGANFVEDEEPLKYKSLIHSMKGLAHGTRVFESTNKGVFVTQLGDKVTRMLDEFHSDNVALKNLTLEALRRGEIDELDVLCQNDKLSKANTQPVEIRRSYREDHDCETVLSTYSTLYNHPNVIAPLKTLKPRKMPKRMQPKVDEEDEEDEEVADGEVAGMTRDALCHRTEDETPEEKKLRRAAVKQLQRERRAAKKDTKLMYRAESLKHRIIVNPNAKAQRVQTSMSLVRPN